MEQNSKEKQTLYVEDSLAKISVLMGDKQVSKVKSQGYSLNLQESAKNVNQSSSSLKTQTQSLKTDSIKFCKELPKSGSMRNGEFYQREPLELHICAKDGGAFVNEKMLLDSNVKKSLKNFKNDSKLSELIKEYKIKAGGRLNPRYLEWLMNFPDKWTKLKD